MTTVPAASDAEEANEALEETEPIGEVVTGSPRYTSAEALEAEPVIEPERRSA